MTNIDVPIEVFVTGYVLSDPTRDEDAWRDVADDLASDIGGRLADLGSSCGHGEVVLRWRGGEVTS